MPYRPLDLPFSEHNKIRTSRDVQAATRKLAEDLARKAGARAGDVNGYEVTTEVGRDRVRCQIHAESGKAIRAEVKDSPLMQLSAEQGPKGLL
ncbi:neck protein [Mycobacterium phage Ekdilam]|uniref:Head-to-tail connector protein n=1 Tax=Mycobacterium phage Ekdilam TaxID=2599862 RepID=A0A5J6TND9_9CAUD|nr:neck protein [Mycobacterium phage Ekdilam]QFG11437.1 hypothetical protein PBI_EKDILAM_13 [Mycobacterium phage Ekdilam]